jgi:hypothetical protein
MVIESKMRVLRGRSDGEKGERERERERDEERRRLGQNKPFSFKDERNLMNGTNFSLHAAESLLLPPPLFGFWQVSQSPPLRVL